MSVLIKTHLLVEIRVDVECGKVYEEPEMT